MDGVAVGRREAALAVEQRAVHVDADKTNRWRLATGL
jgi:hypothetical protein